MRIHEKKVQFQLIFLVWSFIILLIYVIFWKSKLKDHLLLGLVNVCIAILKSKLDRVFCKRHVVDLWDSLDCSALPRNHSDHNLLLLCLNKSSLSRPHLFRFYLCEPLMILLWRWLLKVDLELGLVIRYR